MQPTTELSPNRERGSVSETSVRSPVAGRDILIDTYNLRLRKGSGIKTYGVTLVDALQRLEADVSLLGDRPVGRSKHKALEEVLFYDQARRDGRIRRALRGAAALGRSVFTGVRPREIEQNLVIPDPRMQAVSGAKHIFNQGRVYDAANETFRRLGKFTKVRPPAGVDIWHATTVLPIRVAGAKMVTTIHDLIPLRLPYTTLDDKKFFYEATREAIRVSDLVITISENTKKDILSFFPDTPEDKIHITYQAAPFHLYQPNEQFEQKTLERWDLERQNYLLFVGNVEPKKNVRTLIEAAGTMVEDIPLVIVGRKGWLWKDQLEPAKSHFSGPAASRLRLLDYVSRQDLRVLYANASCLVFPSLYEGFGLPPLEAMAHSCPVITSDVSSLPEVCGDAALYVDPYDADSIRTQIERLLGDGAERQSLVQKGYQRLQRFSAAKYQQRLGEVYAKLL